MSDVVLVAHHGRVEAATMARTAAQWLASHGHHAWMLADDAAALDLGDLAAERAVGSADLVVSLGGDGTMLRAIKSMQVVLLCVLSRKKSASMMLALISITW